MEYLVDDETGEITLLLQTFSDAETGEPEKCAILHKALFQIPKNVQQDSELKRNKIRMEPVPVGTSFGQINPIFLFLPAIIYFRWFAVLLMVFEVIFHIWAHRKNKVLKDTSVYFRSPFHAISSEYCALCQNENCMERVGKIHQARMQRFLRHCNYMNRVVT